MRQSSKNLLILLAIILFTILFMWAVSQVDPHVVNRPSNDDYFPIIIPQPDGSILVF